MIPQPYLLDERRIHFLAGVLKPYVHEGDSMIDLGCGAGLLRKHFPETKYTGVDQNPEAIKLCKKESPDAVWLCKNLSDIKGFAYDIVVHAGIPSLSYNAWDIHTRLYPEIVLLEAGHCVEDKSDTVLGFNKVMAIYKKRGYESIYTGKYSMDGPVPERFFELMRLYAF